MIDSNLFPDKLFATKRKINKISNLLDEVLYCLLALNNNDRAITFKEGIALKVIDDTVKKMNELDLETLSDTLSVFLNVIRDGI